VKPAKRKYRILKRFKSRKTAYFSFIIISTIYIGSFFLPVFVGNSALIVRYSGKYFLPFLNYYEAKEFGEEYEGEANYRLLKNRFSFENSDNFVIMPFYPFGPEENLLNELSGNPPHPPSLKNFFGTDESGRDVFVRVLYGFRLSFTFALIVTLLSVFIGIITGSISGYLKGWFDIIGQRFIEVFMSVPFLYLMMVLSSIFQPGFFLLVIMLSVFGWMGISLYVRGEFLKEAGKEYVQSAILAGSSTFKIVVRHILPNAFTPVFIFLPFIIIANIGALVSLDFLGFGIPPPAPSWGNMIAQGLNNLNYWWLVLFPLLALFITLLLIVFIGEGLRYSINPEKRIGENK